MASWGLLGSSEISVNLLGEKSDVCRAFFGKYDRIRNGAGEADVNSV